MVMENIVTLRSEHYCAQIDMARGANCISLRNLQHRACILREPDPTDPNPNPFLVGMPILFPANRISGGQFTFEGRIYRLPINEPATGCHLHGELYKTPFVPVQQSCDRVVCVWEGICPGYPHQMRITLDYRLSHRGLALCTQIANLSQENMPVFLGFHTTFRLPFLEQSSPENVQVLADVSHHIQRDMITYLPTGTILPPDTMTQALRQGAFIPYGKDFSRHYQSDGLGRIALYDTKYHLRLVYENDRNYPWRMLYKGPPGDYICLEPMNALINCPNGPFDHHFAPWDVIAPGTSKQYTSRIYLEEDSV